jgi:hypothetical protein
VYCFVYSVLQSFEEVYIICTRFGFRGMMVGGGACGSAAAHADRRRRMRIGGGACGSA